MNRTRPLALAAALLAGGPLVASLAQDRPASTTSLVRDDARMFSPEAIRRADRELDRLEREHRVAVRVVTVESLGGDGLDEVAESQARQVGRPAILILIDKADRKIEATAAPRALRDEVGRDRLHKIRDAVIDEFKRRQVDEGLARGVEAASIALAEVGPMRRREPASFAPETRGTTTATTTGPSSAPGSPLVMRGQVRLTLAGARAATASAEAKAAERGFKMNIAVVDEAGGLVAFSRMDGARPASIATATTKAISAATFRQPTGPMPAGAKEPDLLLNLSLQNAAADGGARISSLLGGLPIVVDGQTVGALGVAGGSGEQDLEVARAGLAGFTAAIEHPPAVAEPGPVERARESIDRPKAESDKPKAERADKPKADDKEPEKAGQAADAPR